MGHTRKDALGDRMKKNYENRSRHFFPRRTYTLLRIDGKAFHTYTRGLTKPYDLDLMTCIDAAAIALCQMASGAQFAYTQSDEISILLTDFESIDTEAWFDGSQSKLESITASIATMAFNLKILELRGHYAALGQNPPITKKQPVALFDSRAWTVSDPTEVENYFIWRQKDAERNSLTMLAGAYASHKQLQGKGAAERHDIIFAGGDNWNDHPANFKRGRVIRRVVQVDDCLDPIQNAMVEAFNSNPRRPWMVDNETPIFSGPNRTYLSDLIPRI